MTNLRIENFEMSDNLNNLKRLLLDRNKKIYELEQQLYKQQSVLFQMHQEINHYKKTRLPNKIMFVMNITSVRDCADALNDVRNAGNGNIYEGAVVYSIRTKHGKYRNSQ